MDNINHWLASSSLRFFRYDLNILSILSIYPKWRGKPRHLFIPSHQSKLIEEKNNKLCYGIHTGQPNHLHFGCNFMISCWASRGILWRSVMLLLIVSQGSMTQLKSFGLKKNFNHIPSQEIDNRRYGLNKLKLITSSEINWCYCLGSSACSYSLFKQYFWGWTSLVLLIILFFRSQWTAHLFSKIDIIKFIQGKKNEKRGRSWEAIVGNKEIQNYCLSNLEREPMLTGTSGIIKQEWWINAIRIKIAWPILFTLAMAHIWNDPFLIVWIYFVQTLLSHLWICLKICWLNHGGLAIQTSCMIMISYYFFRKYILWYFPLMSYKTIFYYDIKSWW